MTKHKHIVKSEKGILLTVSDKVIDEVMSEDWQSHFYHFGSKEEAYEWLAYVIDMNDGNPGSVDGLAHLTRNDVTTGEDWIHLDYEQEVTDE